MKAKQARYVTSCDATLTCLLWCCAGAALGMHPSVVTAALRYSMGRYSVFETFVLL